MRISDWSSDVCSSDLYDDPRLDALVERALAANTDLRVAAANLERARAITREVRAVSDVQTSLDGSASVGEASNLGIGNPAGVHDLFSLGGSISRSEEHTSELQSLMRISYAVFCLKKKKN